MDFRAAGFYQIGGKRGKIGRVLPGMMARLTDPENPWGGQCVPPGEPGMLLVRGPNVMRGYLGLPGKNRRCPPRWLVLHWRCRHRGRGRLPANHRPPEPLQQDRRRNGPAPQDRGKIAGARRRDRDHVCGRRRARRKEGRTPRRPAPAGAGDLAACWRSSPRCDLPNLWKPKADAFFSVENFPLLGTGKLDLRAVKDLAAKLAHPTQ